MIGAGPAGLAAAKALADRGISFDWFEKGSMVAGLWRIDNDNGGAAAYETLHLNSSRPLTQYPSFPMPADWPDYPSHELMARYFQDFADHFDLTGRVTFNTPVEKVETLSGAGRPGSGPPASAPPPRRGEQVTVGGGGGFSLTSVGDDSFALYAGIFGGGRGSVGLPAGSSGSGNFGVELAAGYALQNIFTPGSNFIIHTDGDREALILGLGLRVEGVFGAGDGRALFALPVYLQLYWGT